MQNTLNSALSDVISALHSPRFTSTLVTLISKLVDYDCAVVLGYRQHKHPIYLYDSIDDQRDLLFQRYLTNSFQNDPFYLMLNQQQQQGVFTLTDIAKQGIDYQQYQTDFYQKTGWQDELSILIEIEPTRWIVLYLGYLQSDKRFKPQQVETLKSYFSVISSLCQTHWRQGGFTLASPVMGTTGATDTTKNCNNDTQQASDHIRIAIEQALLSFGESLLTKREQQVTALLAQGFDTKEIAEQLGVTQGTVKNHRKRIYAQLNVNSLSELFQLFLNHLITHTPSIPAK